MATWQALYNKMWVEILRFPYPRDDIVTIPERKYLFQT